MKRASRGVSKTTRRSFLKTTAGVAGLSALAASLPKNVLGSNERIAMGLVGTGRRGMQHVDAIEEIVTQGDNLRVLGVYDVWAPRMKAAIERTEATPFDSLEKLLEVKEIDAIVIATPDHLHLSQALKTVEAGKEVYLEAPMAHWSQYEQAVAFVKAVRDNSRVVQVGTQGISGTVWKQVARYLRKETLGAITGASASFAADGDPVEAMAVPKELKAGDALDWKAFLGDLDEIPFDADRFCRWQRYLATSGGPGNGIIAQILTPLMTILRDEEPTGVTAGGKVAKYAGSGREVPDECALDVQFEGGKSVKVAVTFGGGEQAESVVTCEKGSVGLGLSDWTEGCTSAQIRPTDGDASEMELRAVRPGSTVEHWRDFLASIRFGSDPRSHVDLSLRVQKAISLGMEAIVKAGK